MGRKRTKKLNPRRIPLAKREIDVEEILEEATKDDLYHAWLLAMVALVDQEMISIDELQELTDKVNDFINNSTDATKDATRRAEAIVGISHPYHNLRIDKVSSAVDLEAFKRKVGKLAIHTALCVLCLGLDSTGRFTIDELRRIFFNVDLTLAEMDHGITSFTALEKQLAACGVVLERVSDDIHHARIIAPT